MRSVSHHRGCTSRRDSRWPAEDVGLIGDLRSAGGIAIAAAGAALLASCSEPPPEPPAPLPPLVPAERLAAGDFPAVTLADTRPRGAFLAGHPAGAVPLPLEPLEPAPSGPEESKRIAGIAAALAAAGLAPGSPVVMVDDATREGFERAAYGCWLAALTLGARCHLLSGGLAAWEAAGGKLVEGEPDPPPHAGHAGEPATSHLASLDDLREATAGAPTGLVDVRPGRPPDRIPGAFRLPLDHVVDPAGTVLEARLRRAIERSGLSIPDRLIVLGSDAREGAAGWFLLHRVAGIERVALFPGGVPRWRRYPSLPLEPSPPEGKEEAGRGAADPRPRERGGTGNQSEEGS
ncbi:MAG: hypothetical protein D6718_01640 [Acidobacteria bacterium]|nr:MAG: hypothetical protein D6718_01640 [Acidobacteriota bacterium]